MISPAFFHIFAENPADVLCPAQFARWLWRWRCYRDAQGPMDWPELDTLPGRPGMVLQKTHQIDVMIGSSSYSQYIELILIGEKNVFIDAD